MTKVFSIRRVLTVLCFALLPLFLLFWNHNRSGVRVTLSNESGNSVANVIVKFSGGEVRFSNLNTGERKVFRVNPKGESNLVLHFLEQDQRHGRSQTTDLYFKGNYHGTINIKIHPGYKVDWTQDLKEYKTTTNPTVAGNFTYHVVYTQPKADELGYAPDKAIIIYLDQPLPDSIKSIPSFVVYQGSSPETTATGTATILPGRKIVAFVPSPILKESDFIGKANNYRIQFDSATTGIPNLMPFIQEFYSGSKTDNVGLWVQMVSPDRDFIDVDINYHPWLILNEPLDPKTISSDNVVFQKVDKTPVSVVVTFDYSNNALMISPLDPLSNDTLYEVTLNLKFHNLSGMGFIAPYYWQFRTRSLRPSPNLDLPNPYVKAIEPQDFASSVASNTKIKVVFSAPIDQATLTTGNVHLQSHRYGEITDIITELGYDPSKNCLFISPIKSLPDHAQINITLDLEAIKSGSLTLQGNNTFRFYTP